MAHNKQFLKKYITEKFGIVQVIDKLDFHPVTNEEGLFYKVKRFNGMYEYMLQKDLKNLKNS